MREWDNGLTGTWLFPSRIGEHIKSIQDGWEQVLKEANITGFRLYDLRHSFASALVSEGVSIYEVAELLGHADVSQTKVYAHLAPDTLHNAVELHSVDGMNHIPITFETAERAYLAQYLPEDSDVYLDDVEQAIDRWRFDTATSKEKAVQTGEQNFCFISQYLVVEISY